MDDKSNNPYQLKPKKQKFLSEYESLDSQSASYRIKDNRSTKLMRRLKQLRNKQKYLTDDQFDSSKDQRGPIGVEDSSMEIEAQSSFYDQKANKTAQMQKIGSEMQKEKSLHPRQQSSSDEKWNTIRKSKEVPLYRKDNPITQLPINNQLQQIEAFNSEIENQHSH